MTKKDYPTREHSSFFRVISLGIAILFVFNSLPRNAFAQNSDLQVQEADESLIRQTQKIEAQIPPELGFIEESYEGRSGRTVIYLQDAHNSLEAQEKIAAIIEHLVGNMGVRTVFEEGYEGEVPTDKYFGSIQDPRVKERVAYFLMDKLRISGAEYAHINRQKEFQLIGVDQNSLHQANLLSYRRTAEHREVATRSLRDGYDRNS